MGGKISMKKKLMSPAAVEAPATEEPKAESAE